MFVKTIEVGLDWLQLEIVYFFTGNDKYQGKKRTSLKHEGIYTTLKLVIEMRQNWFSV